MEKQNLYIIPIVIIFIGLVGYFIYIDIMAKNAFVQTTVADGKQAEVVSESAPAEVINENIPIPQAAEQSVSLNKTSVSAPDLDRSIQISDSISPAQKEEIASKINNTIALLKNNRTLLDGWLDLGLLRKLIGDYEGARAAWEYAGILAPKNSISFGNLGVLYGYYLKDSVSAEKNYLKAIENDPALPDLYMRAADFYLEVMNNPQKAQIILEKGAKAIPEDMALKSALENIN